MKLKSITFQLLLILTLFVLTLSPLFSKRAEAGLTHPPQYFHIKTYMSSYGLNYPADQLEFMATHYDARFGAGKQDSGDVPKFTYTNYYCMYVGKAEFLDAQAWATAHNVSLEDFFLHYSEPTTVKLEGISYTLPAGSRIPTYGWYGTGGDMTKTGARVVMNVGNPNYRAWKLDEIRRQQQTEGADGVFIDNTSTAFLAGNIIVVSGGAITEYPSGLFPAYGDAIVTMFAEMKEGGLTQAPNIGPTGNDTRLYSYAWGVVREGVNQPGRVIHLDQLEQMIAAASTAGANTLLGSYWTDQRWDMAALAVYYLLKDDHTYFRPFLAYLSGDFDLDPRINQWIPAVAYNVGQPTAKRYLLKTGLDPSSPMKETVTATVTHPSGSIYRLTVPGKAWADNVWRYKYLQFPNGFISAIYRSGQDWLELYLPGQIPTDGIYQIASYTYSVQARDYTRALVLWRPRPENVPDDTDASAAMIELPQTDDNPSGHYYKLNRDGNVEPTPLISISLRNSDGEVLIKESALNQPTISKNVDKPSTQSGDTITYTLSYSNPTNLTFTTSKIEDPIPSGTTYIDGSTTGGAVFDSASNKIILSIGTLPPNANGTITFKVKVQ